MKDLIITDDNAKKTVNGEGIFKKTQIVYKTTGCSNKEFY